jgi:hypothetical protein
MPSPAHYKSYYLQNRVPNPVNITLTERQVVDGQWITDTLSQQNFRHFAKKLNAKCFGNKFKRYGHKLLMFVVREQDHTHRHHIHCVIERPQHIAATDFILLAQSCWTSTRFGYQQSHFEFPTTEQRELGWIDYCLKARTKTEYSDCIDWSNSTCFELR